jgi:type I restriction enzyme S subunit
MSKKNENELMPNLRFPNFSNKESWKTCDLIDTADKKIRWSFTGGPFGSNLKASDYTEKGVRIIQLQNIGDGVFLDDYKIFTSEEKADELLSCNIYSGEIILSKMGDPVGRACMIPDHLSKCVMASDGIRLVVDKKRYSKFFIYSLINSKQIRDAIEKKSTGSTRKRIGLDELKHIPLPIPPSLEEQQKIATCLSSLDEIITAESQKLDILKGHKKGLLQNLLPQEGETVPTFRFKEFKEFEDMGDWEETTLTQVADYENGKAHEQDIADDGKFIVVNSKFISQDGEVKKFTNTAFLPATKGDILMVLSDIPNGRAIAKCFLVEEDNRYTVNQRICRLTPRNINSKILYYLLNRNPYFLDFDDGVKQTNLRKEDVLNCPLLIPSDPKEQDKIANTLSSIDELINAQSQKLEALQLHKKGLLQGLFPNLNEDIA